MCSQLRASLAHEYHKRNSAQRLMLGGYTGCTLLSIGANKPALLQLQLALLHLHFA